MKNNTASSGTKTRGRAAAGGTRGRRGASQSQGNVTAGAPTGGAVQSTEASAADWTKARKARVSLLKKQITAATAIGAQLNKTIALNNSMLEAQQAELRQLEPA